MNRVINSVAIGLGLLVSANIALANTPKLPNGDSVYGKPTASAPAAKVVDVATAKNLRVECGEVVTFRNGDKTFSWKFDVAGHRAVDLQAIAPTGFGSAPLTVYVGKNSLERN